MLLRINRFSFLLMIKISIQIKQKIINSIDSDDILALALSIEDNFPKEETDKLKIMLKGLLISNGLNIDEADRVRQFLNFMQ